MPKIVVGVSGSLGCLAALHRAAAEARLRRAELWAVLAWETPGGELGGRYSAHVSAVAQCRATAGDRLREALDTAFGPVRPEIPVQGVTVWGSPGAALVDVAQDPDDLLVVGTGARGPLRRLVHRSVARYCQTHAVCPVLAVPPSPLLATYDTTHRRNLWHMPLDPREVV
ncbi:universal stress protein [Streptomyces sp. NBC_00250]|uniref:universal stress protein n=1 Tax=Streptomyces sp. NBC_00250 TaxID=2903641 RepID=UPI002E2C2426|nr:universal stress protein [Streptomyces sp. NBC_00250]